MERYEIGCSVCGVIGYEACLADALRVAQRQQEQRHNTENETVTVYDRLAHHGKPELYTPKGTVIETKA